MYKFSLATQLDTRSWQGPVILTHNGTRICITQQQGTANILQGLGPSSSTFSYLTDFTQFTTCTYAPTHIYTQTMCTYTHTRTYTYTMRMCIHTYIHTNTHRDYKHVWWTVYFIFHYLKISTLKYQG